MTDILVHKVALITGAGRGIGKAIARGMAEAGADLLITDLDEKSLQKTADEISGAGTKIVPLAFNINDMNAMKKAVGKAVAEFGKIDVLINSAGINIRKHFLEVTEESFEGD